MDEEEALSRWNCSATTSLSSQPQASSINDLSAPGRQLRLLIPPSAKRLGEEGWERHPRSFSSPARRRHPTRWPANSPSAPPNALRASLPPQSGHTQHRSHRCSRRRQVQRPATQSSNRNPSHQIRCSAYHCVEIMLYSPGHTMALGPRDDDRIKRHFRQQHRLLRPPNHSGRTDPGPKCRVVFGQRLVAFDLEVRWLRRNPMKNIASSKAGYRMADAAQHCVVAKSFRSYEPLSFASEPV